MPPGDAGAGERPASPASQGAFAAALAGNHALGGLTDGTGRPAADRLSVYRNNVIVSLREALRTTFPATRRLMGEEYFDAAAVAYAASHKPASPILFRYGASFADHLESLPGLAGYPFVPEVARIEHARVQSYHSADAGALEPQTLAVVAPDELAGLTFAPHPATRLVAAPHGGVMAFQDNHRPPLARSEGVAALITRPRMDVETRAVSGAQDAFVSALLRGHTLAQAASEAETLDLSATLAILLQAGAFKGLARP